MWVIGNGATEKRAKRNVREGAVATASGFTSLQCDIQAASLG